MTKSGERQFALVPPLQILWRWVQHDLRRCL